MDPARHWRTQLPAEYAAQFGCGEVHAAIFQHRDDPGGPYHCIAVQLPETSRALINEAMRRARKSKARILIVADTAQQVTQAVARIERRCPGHHRVPFERASAGGFGPTM